MRDEKGFALVAVLAILAVVALLSGAVLELADAGVVSVQDYSAEIEGSHSVEAAIRLTAIRLADTDGYAISELSQGEIEWRGWSVVIRVEDEAAKLDANRIPRSALAVALRRIGAPPAMVAKALSHPGRFVSVDTLAGRQASPALLEEIRSRITVYGSDTPQATAERSSLETYRIVASATRHGRSVARFAILRITSGFGEPFEWLEQGTKLNVIQPSSKSTQK